MGYSGDSNNNEAAAVPSILLDVLTSLSDCRHETVERIMERRISGVSCMCWMDFHNAMLCCGFLCARQISLYSVSFLCLFCVYIPATTPRATTPHLYRTGYHAFTTTAQLSRLCMHPGYHAIVLCSIPRLSHLSYHAPPHT